jgi:hypothetical protein
MLPANAWKHIEFQRIANLPTKGLAPAFTIEPHLPCSPLACIVSCENILIASSRSGTEEWWNEPILNLHLTTYY